MRILLLIFSIYLFGCAGAVPVKPEDATFQKVIELHNLPKDTIYERSKQWVAVTFKSAKAVIEYDNKQEGLIIGNGTIQRPPSDLLPFGSDHLVVFSMREDIKEGKARLTFENIMVLVPPNKYGTGGDYPLLQDDLRGVRVKFITMAEDLKKYILNDESKEW